MITNNIKQNHPNKDKSVDAVLNDYRKQVAAKARRHGKEVKIYKKIVETIRKTNVISSAEVLNEDSLKVDQESTLSLRHDRLKLKPETIWSPKGPGEGLFWKTRFRDGDKLVSESTPAALQLGLSPEAR